MPGRENESLRSIYGVKTYSPEETKNQWKEEVEKERNIHQTHSSSKLERAAIGQAKKKIKETSFSYFNNNKEHNLVSSYDRQFHAEEGYHSRLKRDDRKHVLGLNVNSEEWNKIVPSLSSSAYGRRRLLEQPTRKHCRVALVQRDFFRNCGANI